MSSTMRVSCLFSDVFGQHGFSFLSFFLSLLSFFFLLLSCFRSRKLPDLITVCAGPRLSSAALDRRRRAAVPN